MEKNFYTARYYEIVDKNGRVVGRCPTLKKALALADDNSVWRVKRCQIVERGSIVATIYRRLIKD